MRTTTLLAFSLLLILLVGCKIGPTSSSDHDPRKIEILFLGHDQELHNSRAYLPILAAALAQEGINFSYFEDPEILADEGALQKYDGILLYANHDSISSKQEAGLFNFIQGGKGFIPIHSASFCFRNSDEFVELLGAQFKEHGTGVFSAAISNVEHDITAGLDTFSAWDETYVHHLHNEDKTVLMVREENGKSEPWTWVRSHGQGRIFYTASGHDGRTWGHPGFQELLKRGILWAVGDRVRGLWEAYRENMPQLQYEENVGPIPNYEQRSPAPRLQTPLSPEASQKLMQVPPGFQLELFASEPDIINPIAMDWDEKGRLWVIETVDYPNTVREVRSVGDDRIKICEDTDGDGRADKFTIFADQLNIPTSMVFVNGGVLIAQAPHFIFLKDEDGDDKADVREIVINGWGTYDTHAGPSNLQYGMDNNIWGVVGYSGFEGEIAGAKFQFRQGIYHFSRQFDNFEFLSGTSNNTWGLGFTAENEVFASTANNTHSVYLSIPDRYFKNIKGIPPGGNYKIDGHYDIQPITANYRQVDVFGGFTAAAGHHFYTAKNYPESYHNRAAFICEPTGGLVHLAMVEKTGAGFVEKDGGNLLAGADEWVSPVEAKVGPDGQVWVADWYNFIIQHNPTPSLERGGFAGENGAGNAHVNPLRDKSHGRIWRVVYKGNTKQAIQSLDRNNSKELLAALSADNRFWRMTAQRLLVESGNKELVPQLIGMLENSSSIAGLHAVWILDGLQALDQDEVRLALERATSHSEASIRKAALQVLNKNGMLKPEMVDKSLLEENDPNALLQTLLLITERASSVEIGKTLYQLSKRESITEDEFLSKAIYIAADQHQDGFIAAYLEEHPDFIQGKPLEVDWGAVETDDTSLEKMTLPNFIENVGLDIDGEIWFRVRFQLTKTEASKGIELHLGPIDDSDETYLNGQKVGGMTAAYDKKRIYTVPAKVLKAGDNLIAIKMTDTGGGGGILGEDGVLFYVSGNEKKSLPSEWKYKVTKLTSASGTKLFSDQSLAEVFVTSYWGDFDSNATTVAEIVADKTIELGVIKNEMKYDLKEFIVTAGETVSIVFKNDDFMQHNLIIGAPGSLNTIGAAADQLATMANGSAQGYIPEIPQVLFHTRLVNPNESVTLTFKVPDDPGDYPFVCTFPGHWSIMNGIMKVEKNPL